MEKDVIIEACTRPSEHNEMYEITFSSGDVLEFSEDEVAEYGLYREGETCGDFDNLCTVILSKRMMASVASYVLFSAKTSSQVKMRLEADLKKGKFDTRWERFGENAIFEAIKRLKELGYIDDVSYAEKYIASALKGKPVSKAAILNDLVYKKGIDRDIAEAVVNIAFEKDNISDEESAYRLLYKKTGGHIPEDQKELSKIYRFAVGKGFSFATTEGAIRRIKAGDLYQYEYKLQYFTCFPWMCEKSG